MTIDISASAPAPNPVAKPAARTQNAQTAADSPAVSFLSLLDAMGLGAADAAAAMAEVGVEKLSDARVDTQAIQDDTTSQAALAQMQLTADWWAQAVPIAPAVPVAAVSGLASLALAGGQGPRASVTSATAQARAMESAEPFATEAAGFNPPARLNATSELQQLSAHALTGQQDGDAAPLSSRDFMARVEAARTEAQADTTALRTAGTPVGGTPSLGQVLSLFDTAVAGLHAGGALRSQERNQHRMPVTGASQGLVTWGDATPAGTQHGASSVYAPGALTPAPATAMAEKVHYWVSRGVQSAELQLDAFAGGSVDVSIAVKGHEATIEFRTDQPQARQLLLEAMPQLKELLAGEGLMLSGGFVGSSAQQGGQPQGRGALPTTTREALVGVPPAAPGRAELLDGASGRRVDLFV